MNQLRRLPLEGLQNARELGGWTCDGGVTNYGVFLRAEVPDRLTQADIAYLRDYGVTLDIDVRGDSELEMMPDLLAGCDWIDYRHIPMFNMQAARGADMDNKAHNPPPDFSWGAEYIGMVEKHKDWVVSIMNTLAQTGGIALYHCTTGKDRTGIITALLLGLCGVSDADIIADYCVSQIYLRPMYMRISPILFSGSEFMADNPFFITAPENMFALLEHINSSYGGAAGYLADCGVSQDTVSAIKAKLIGK